MMNLKKAIQRYNVPAIFVESTINPKLMKQIAKDNNVVIGGSLFADSLGEKDTPAGTYIGMLKYNTQTIVDGLTKEREANLTEVEEEGSSNIWLIAGIGLVMLLGLVVVGRKMSKG